MCNTLFRFFEAMLNLFLGIDYFIVKIKFVPPCNYDVSPVKCVLFTSLILRGGSCFQMMLITCHSLSSCGFPRSHCGPTSGLGATVRPHRNLETY